MLPSGGGIRVLRQFTGGLRERYQIKVYRPAGGSPLTDITGVREEVIPYPMWRRPSASLKAVAPVFLVFRLLAFKKVCRSAAQLINKDADAAVVHNSMPIAAPPVLNYLNIPSLYFCYEYPRHLYEKDIISRTGSAAKDLLLKPLEILEKSVDGKAVAAASSITTFSTYMRERIHSIYNREAGIVPPGVDTEAFTPGSEPAEDNYLLSVGALWPFKGHETAIRILGEIPASQRPELHIVADREFPGFSSRLSALAETLSVSLRIRKQVPDSVLLGFYRRAKMVLCCQRREPYGLVPLEAMACGTPVLAVSQGGFTDNITHGDNGFLFDGTVQHGSSILEEVLGNQQKRLSVAEAGLRYVRENRSLSSGIDKLAEEIDSL